MIDILLIEKNKEYNVEIEAVSSDGNGIAHIDGFTVFVPNTVKGDFGTVRIVKVKSSYGYGKMTEIKKASTDRIEPMCEHYKLCGGCQLLHMNYKSELDLKKDIIESALKRIGGFNDIEVDDVIGSETRSGYRNKMIFPIGEKDTKPISGFYSQRSHNIVEMESCMLGDDICANILRVVKEYMQEFGVRAYDEGTQKGVIRRVFIRKGHKKDEVMVVVSANSNSLKNSDILVDRLMSVSNRIKSIILNVNTKKTNIVLGEKNITLWGKDRISDTLCGIDYEISPHSFFQINPQQTEKLYGKAMEFANFTGRESVLDVYCGIGTISLYAAKNARKVIGVEIIPQAIADAKENAVRNGISNCEFYADSAENIVPKLIENGERPDVVILDPPRKGSDEKTLSAIAMAQPERIVYVSCNPATLARDMRFLADKGYAVEKAVGVDMFPGTVHVECVVLMTKVQN